MFDLNYPPRILFGWGVRGRLQGLLEESGWTRVLLVATSSVLPEAVLSQWQRDCGGRICASFGPVPHDPSLAVVEEIRCLAVECKAEAILAVGGGSVIDAAKAAAVLVPASAPLKRYFDGEEALTQAGLPLIAVPTTAGSGAEITRNAVLTDTETAVKQSLRGAHMVPRAALVDPELTLSMPPALTAASGLDAFTQAVESYVSSRANSVSQALALKASELIFVNLPLAFRNGAARQARTAVAEGSLLSAMAFSQSGLGAVHGLAHPIGAVLNLPHGLTCAVLLPHILKWNHPVCADLMADLGRACGLPEAGGFVNAVGSLCAELGVPETFADYGLGEQHYGHILAHCRSNSMQANPRHMSDEDIIALLERLAG